MLKAILDKLIGRREATYEEARGALERQDRRTRLALAERPDAPPEMLYYLASDPDAEIRRKIAANAATPVHAGRLLVQDVDDEVRGELARKIARLLPGLSTEEQGRLRELAIEVLEKLASDHLSRVRQIVAEEIKNSDKVPARLAKRLAMDLELIVAAPVLEYSPLLSDEDLLEIIARGAVDGALSAIARRPAVSLAVTDAIVATLDVPAVATLLGNPNAQIREEALDRIADHAESIAEWHRPIVMRADLSVRAIRRVAGFVASALLDELMKHTSLDTETAKFLGLRVRERLKEEKASVIEGQAEPELSAEQIVAEAYRTDELDDLFIASQCDQNRRDVVIQGLAVLAKVPPKVVTGIIDSKNAKPVVALCWHTGLGMRTALKVQAVVARLPGKDQILPKGGTDYPLTPQEMTFHLEYFGIKLK